jgi:hypothetical protein
VFVLGEKVVYSASDLAAAARCQYALLRVFDAKLGRGPAVTVEDELLARTAALGDQHERRRLARLRDEFDDQVAVIGRPAYTLAGLTAAAEATRRAIADRAPVVYQAAMFDGRFVGFADFLVRDGQQYRVVDTKLARSAKVPALLQLAAYADTLARAGVAVAPEAELVTAGLGEVAAYRRRRGCRSYRRRRWCRCRRSCPRRRRYGRRRRRWGSPAPDRPVLCPQPDSSPRDTMSGLCTTPARENLDVTTVTDNNGAHDMVRIERQRLVAGSAPGHKAPDLLDLSRPTPGFVNSPRI